ncbi:large-conductance mechanosensitive channel [Biscogniauxia mediterranea]|nr:large-conductance mechanosensitive channel [Biscogniauxia mediterranea]
MSDEESRNLLQEGEHRAKRVWSEFVDFAFSGNILEIAFGLILANAFTTVTTSFVNDVILPPLSVILPLNRNMDEKFAVLKPGPKYDELDGYAQDDGAVVLAYGVFLSKSISFIGLGIALYCIAASYQWVSKDPIIKRTAKCRYCKKTISDQAIRCVHCTSWLDGREERMR